MAVDINDARHNKLAGEVDDLCAGRRFDVCSRSNSRNPAILDDHAYVRNGSLAGAIDEREILQNFDLREAGERQDAGQR